jgi:hypothetical protein
MAIWPSNQRPDQWPTTGTVKGQSASDIPTMAAHIPPTVASRTTAEFDATAPTAARQPYVPDLAWSNEQPAFASPLPIERPRPGFMPSRVLIFVGGGLVAAAAAGLFATLYGAHGTPVDAPTSHSAPSPAAAPTPTPAPTPTQEPANPAPVNPAPTSRSQTKSVMTTHSVMTSPGPSATTSPQSPSQYSAASSSGQHTNDQSGQATSAQQWPSNHQTVSAPPTWNRNDSFWFTHRRDDDDSRRTHDHDSDDRSPSNRGDNNQASPDQSSDNPSTGSDGNASST